MVKNKMKKKDSLAGSNSSNLPLPKFKVRMDPCSSNLVKDGAQSYSNASSWNDYREEDVEDVEKGYGRGGRGGAGALQMALGGGMYESSFGEPQAQSPGDWGADGDEDYENDTEYRQDEPVPRDKKSFSYWQPTLRQDLAPN